jgi:predicted RecB family nuclease
MQLLDSALRLSATDLSRFLSCRHCTALDMEVAQGLRPKPPNYPDPFLELLIERGLAHEKQYLESIEVGGDEVLDLGDLAFRSPSEAADRTLEAMRKGRPAIAQGMLRCGEWSGIPDVLRRVETKSSVFGPWSYEVYDTKLARETRGTAILQLSLYSDLLAGIQEAVPEMFHVVTPKPVDPVQSFRVADFAAFYRFVRRGLEGVVAGDPSALALAHYPEPVDYCEVCRWWSQCDKRRRNDDHLSFVAGLTRLHTRELEAQGITTLEKLGQLAIPIRFKPHRGSKESIERVADQARLQLQLRRTGKLVHELLQPVEAGRGLAKLPLPSPGDVFLDLEGDHFAREGGREYLFGLTIIEAAGKTRHIKLWAHSDAEEKAAFEKAVDEIRASWAANPGMHVYHYAPYETSAFKRLMGRHITRETEIDEMLRAGLFVDLLFVVKQGLRASVEGYSIKDLERFYGFERHAVLSEAGAARRIIEQALEAEAPEGIPPELRTLVEDYNQEDCVSALRLRDWLEILRGELERGGTPVPRPLPLEGGASEKVKERKAGIQKAMDALLAGVPAAKSDRTPEQHARWLLAHMLEFHRREENVSWWEFYRLRDLVDEDDLLDERAVVTGLKFVKRTAPTGRGKCPIDRYAFTPQDFDAHDDDELFTKDGKTLGDIVDIDNAACWVDVKKRLARADEHPESAFVHSHVRSDAIAAALLRLAGDLSGAAYDLLRANAPRLASRPFARMEGESSLDLATRSVLDLDRSILPIQGPPGAGKTYAGARMIVECVRKGMKVGVSAVTHKVIRKLLEDATKAAPRGMTLSCVQKVRKKAKDKGPEIPGIEQVTDNADVLAALNEGRAQVGAGTAWLWSRPEYAGAVDVLFVDEAGQASLANVLAMSQAARSVVLLGDPQQLQQPQRGTHPEGTDASALQHLLAGHKTIPDDRGIFLAETYRLAPSISSFTSELFYEDRLHSKDGLEKQVLSGAPPYEGNGLWFEPVEHDGNRDSSSEEVAAVEAIVDRLLKKGSRWTDKDGKLTQVSAADILVVAPFNRQVNRLQEALESRGIRVGTVDRFQGQEAAVVIYSMATSRPEDAPRGMEFLYDLNRLNVATSRARCACILAASPRLLEPECKTPRQMRLANAMCRYVDLAGARLTSPATS